MTDELFEDGWFIRTNNNGIFLRHKCGGDAVSSMKIPSKSPNFFPIGDRCYNCNTYVPDDLKEILFQRYSIKLTCHINTRPGFY